MIGGGSAKFLILSTEALTRTKHKSRDPLGIARRISGCGVGAIRHAEQSEVGEARRGGNRLKVFDIFF
jgi:hypothetical protein